MSAMKWKDLEGKTIASVVPDQISVDKYPDWKQPIAQEECWTYGVTLTFSDGTSALIEGLQHDEVGGIELRDKESK